MNRYAAIALAAVLGFTANLQAQSANPLSADTKQSYTIIKDLILKAADQMPDDDYWFRTSPQVRTFAQLVGHVADAQILLCTTLKGEPRRGSAASNSFKVDLVDALKASFAACDQIYDSMTDATGAQTVNLAGKTMTKLGALNLNTADDNQTYGTMLAYLQLKANLPTSGAK